jgi:DNA-binding HxlR family transcriptional regulator
VGLIDVVGKKWAACVVSLLGKYGKVRFGLVQQCLCSVSPATVTSTLRSLEQARLIERVSTDGPRGPVRAYALTDAGSSLYRSLLPLARGSQPT